MIQLFNTGELDDLCTKLEQVIKAPRTFDPEKLNKHAFENFSYDSIVTRITDVYNEILNGTE